MATKSIKKKPLSIEDQVKQAIEFGSNWFDGRKIPYTENTGVYGYPDSNILNMFMDEDRKDILNHSFNSPSIKVVKKIDGNNDIQGQFDRDKNRVILKKNGNRGTIDHEITHFLTDLPLSTRLPNQAIVDKFIRPKDSLSKYYKDKYDYFSSGDEVLARLMFLRRMAGFKPDQKITQEHIDNFRKTYNNESSDINQLSDLFDDNGLINILNLMSSNKNNNPSIITAEYGLGEKSIKKYPLGGKTDDSEDALVKTLTQLARKGQFKLAEIIGLGSEVKFATETGEKYFSEDEQHNAKGDAMRHLLLQAQLMQKHGEKTAKAISWAHENILDGQSSVEREMDTFNDELGREIGKKAKNKNEMTRMALEAIKKNKIKTLSEEQILETYDMGGVVKKKYPYGGKTNSTIEAEGGEVIETPQGQVGNINGPSHANGGVTMNVPDGSLIFSDRIGIKNNKGKFLSLADRKKIREATLKKLNKRQRDPFQLNTLQRTGEKLAKEEEADVALQTMIRKQVEGDQNNNIPKAALGAGYTGSTAAEWESWGFPNTGGASTGTGGIGLTTGDKLTAGANVGSSLFNVFSTLSSIGDTKPALRMNSNLNKDYGITGLKNLDNVSDNLKVQNTYAENTIKNQLTQNKQDATAAIDNAGGSLNLRRALRADLATKTNKIYSDSMTDLSSALAAKEGELGVTKSNMLNVRDAKVAEGEAAKLTFNSNAQMYDQAVARSNSQASSASGQSVFGAVQSIGSALNTNQKNEQTLGLYNKMLDQSTGGSGLTVPGKFPYGGTTGKQPEGSIQPFIKKGATVNKDDMSATFNRLLSMIQPNNDSFEIPTQKKKSVTASSNNDDNEIISTGITRSPDYSSIRKRTRTNASAKGGSGDVLDLIAKGESSNNYDAVSNSKPLSGLSNMTLQDVMTHAKNTGKHVGAWQFGHNEIETTAKKLGFDLKKTRYSPAVQRQLARQLALDHGLGDFLKGKTSSEKAIYRLSQKWAALPKDKSGRSYYEGKGTNKANINFDELYTTLGSNG